MVDYELLTTLAIQPAEHPTGVAVQGFHSPDFTLSEIHRSIWVNLLSKSKRNFLKIQSVMIIINK
ncbi:MAG TPA: hypothetical protein ENN33_16465 [Ignavibacteria bacterium]|nr:hypothetical protein [Ignavibacteria bacterium]